MFRDVEETRVGGISAENDEAVPELMRSTKEVKASREEAFREARDVEDDTKGVEGVRDEDFVEEDVDDGRVRAPEANRVDGHEDGSRSESAVHHDSEDAEYIAMEERDDRDDEG